MTYTEPLLAVVGVILALVWLQLRRFRGSWLVGLALIVFLVVSWPPIDWLFSRPLEIWYSSCPFNTSAHPQAIVVLSSSVNPALEERPYPQPDFATYQRCTYAAWLHTHWKPLPVLACGGGGGRRQEPYSVTMARLLSQSGVPASIIWVEDRSRSTHENAVFGAQILHSHNITSVVLVVDASSMPRASACFRKAGIEVIPAPSEFRHAGPLWDELLPGWRAVRRNEITLHEMLGLGWYWLRGWI